MTTRRRWTVTVGTVAILAASMFGLGGCFGAPAYHGAKSPHFDGEEFFNTPRLALPGLGKMLKWKLGGHDIPWTQAQAEVSTTKPEAAPQAAIRATFINHATVLLQLDGWNVLTDPVWSERVGPVSWVGPKRQRAPGVRFQDLPRIDAVLISHSHYDHCDVPTLLRLQEAHHPRVFGGLGSAAMLAEHGVTNVTDMDWWQTIALKAAGRPTLTLGFAPAQHWSNRSFTDVNRVLWGSYSVRTTRKYVYFAGDTGWGPHFSAIRAAWGEPDLALLPIGAYEPRWFMHAQHIGPDQAVAAHQELRARRSMAIHWLTFDQSDEGQYQPAGELGVALAAAGLSPKDFVAVENGGVVEADAHVLHSDPPQPLGDPGPPGS